MCDIVEHNGTFFVIDNGNALFASSSRDECVEWILELERVMRYFPTERNLYRP